MNKPSIASAGSGRHGHSVGLGLSIVLALVEPHRGRIELLDSILGGLRVRIVFPLLAGTVRSA